MAPFHRPLAANDGKATRLAHHPADPSFWDDRRIWPEGKVGPTRPTPHLSNRLDTAVIFGYDLTK